MRVSLEWLREYVDIDISLEELAHKLSMTGTSVELVEEVGGELKGVIVAEVTEVNTHPNAENMKICIVNDGRAPQKVVCGAPNVATGQKVALAMPGTVLPGMPSGKLEAAVIRGVKSEGMLCSGSELGLNEEAGVILVLPVEAEPGQPLDQVVPTHDVVLDLEITPNRPDCMSMIGVAREVAAITGAKLKRPVFKVTEGDGEASEFVSVEIMDAEICPRYTARVLTGVKVGESPIWMQRRLFASGIRPINNVVDITNYVLMEWGQPLHAFDLKKLRGNKVLIRLARPGESITTLDGIEHQLWTQALVIADESVPVALAGVMGGEDSEVTEGTTEVLIESACFEPTSVLRTSRRLGMRSEASARFERGSDPEMTAVAADRAAQLMAEHTGATVARGTIDCYPGRREPRALTLRPDRVNLLLGTSLSEDEIVSILESLELPVERSKPLSIEVPSFRGDLKREIDLVEEVARVYGYWNIPSELPPGEGAVAGLTERQHLGEKIVETLLGFGLSQVTNLSFMNPADLDGLRINPDDERRRVVEIMNPVTETGESMRTTLIPGLAKCAGRNFSRGVENLTVFERGRIFIHKGANKLPEERVKIAVALYGNPGYPGWSQEERDVDYFDLKGILEGLAHELSLVGIDVLPGEEPFLVPGRSAKIACGGKQLGYLGMMLPGVAKSFDAPERLWIMEIDEEDLAANAKVEKSYQPLGRFPPVKVDISMVVDKAVAFAEVLSAISRLGGDLLRDAWIFDVYRGEQIPQGKKSLAFSLIFGSEDRTLTDEEVHQRLDAIIEGLESEIGAHVRRSRE